MQHIRKAVRIAFAIGVVALVVSGATPAWARIEQSLVYRFYNQSNGSHFYTASATERDEVSAKYSAQLTYEGPAFYAAEQVGEPEIDSQMRPVWRFYNKKNGSHFYTISAAERDYVASNYSATYALEGEAFTVYGDQVPYWSLWPVHRFYNMANGSHFYTISAEEKDLVRMLWSSTYRYEGIAFYAAPVYSRPF